MNSRLLSVLLFCVSAAVASGCPWCKRFGITETVTADEGDPGGKFFGQAPPAEKTRHYYVAAEPVLWTWAPLGKNVSKPLAPLPPALVAQPSAGKVRYVEYTDATFTRRVLENPRQGLTGPVLRGVTGEYLAVTFRNNGPMPLSMHPHGVRYDKDSEGAWSEPNTGKGSAIAPGGTFTYVWHLDAMSGPQPGEPSSKCWLYHSHTTDDEEVNLGLAGLIVVTDPARARPDGTPADVDREMVALFYMFDETPEDEALEYADTPVGKTMTPRPLLKTLELRETAMRPAINGYLFGNHPGLDMREGERVRWYLGGLGEEDGMHTVHWHGARVREEGRRVVDVISLLPGETKVADQVAENPGTWMIHCHVSDHMMEGMFANFTVLPKTSPVPPVPFYSAAAARQSLRWTKAEVELESPDKPAGAFRAVLHGDVAIFRGYFPQRNPPTIAIGAHSQKLQVAGPDTAAGEGTRWKINGANAQGVVLKEETGFELTLEGAAWRQVFAGLAAGGEKSEVSITVEVGGRSHTAVLTLRLERDGERLRGRLPE